MKNANVTLWHKLGKQDWANNVGIFAYSSASVAFPVLLIAIMSDFGISLEDGGKGLAASLSLGRNTSITVSLVFSGFASLYWGNRCCLRFAMLLSVIFIGLSALSLNFSILLCTLILLGIGEGLIEGLMTPYVEELHRTDLGNCNSYVNLAHSFWPAGVISTTLLAGYLLGIGLHWRWILGGIALLYLLPITLFAPNKHDRPTVAAAEAKVSNCNSMAETFHRGREILSTLSYWRFSAAMFLAGGAEISLTFWAASFVQLQYGSSPFIGGLCTALFAFGMLLGRLLTAHYLPSHLIRLALLVSAITGAVASSALALFSSQSWQLLLLLFICGFFTAPYWPTIQVYTVQRFVKLDRTLLFILLSAAGIPGAGFFPWLLGNISDSGAVWADFLQVPNAFILSLLVVPFCHLTIFGLLFSK